MLLQGHRAALPDHITVRVDEYYIIVNEHFEMNVSVERN